MSKIKLLKFSESFYTSKSLAKLTLVMKLLSSSDSKAFPFSKLFIILENLAVGKEYTHPNVHR